MTLILWGKEGLVNLFYIELYCEEFQLTFPNKKNFL